MGLAVGTRLGPYEIAGPLGAGGMGEVYRAWDSRLERHVAIKVLPDHLGKDPIALNRFEREAKSLAALSHPNILAIYDVGTDENIFYLVAELLEGKTLRELLNQTLFSVKNALQFAIGIVDGLAAAHSKGLIHRDLKPENVFLVSSGYVKILDFGLARRTAILQAQNSSRAATESVVTEKGVIQGTVPYMSPEQLRGNAVDTRTDIFSFGCILYEMLCGRRAFEGKTVVDTISAILNEEPPAIKNVPPELYELVQLCLKKNREQRFQSAHDIAIALKSIQQTSLRFDVESQSTESSALKAKGIESIAVLPLHNLSGNPQQEYFADGITEALIHQLGQLSGLRVISRTSVMQYKQTKIPLWKIAKDLRVEAVLEGSVMLTGDRVKISARLIETVSEKRLWSNIFEGDLRDILTLHNEIVGAVVMEIRLNITPEERTRLAKLCVVDPEAYRFYLRGNFQLNKLSEDAFRKAIADYQSAIEIDPTYAPAYAGMAMAFSELASWNSSLPLDKIYQQAKVASSKALELDDKLAEAHFARAVLKYLHEWDWPGADDAFKTAVELNPSSSHGLAYYSNYLAAMGRFKDSVAIARKAVDADPLSPTTYNWLSWSYWFAGQRKEAYKELQRSKELDPNFIHTGLHQMIYYAFEEKYNEAISEFLQFFGEDFHAVSALVSAYIGWIYGLAGRRTDAFHVLQELSNRPETEKSGAVWLAMIHLGLGEIDEALDLLDKAYENHESSLVWIKTQLVFIPLRDHPRFQDLLKRMNFPNI